MGCRRRRDMARPIGRRRRDRATTCARIARATDGPGCASDVIQPGCRDLGDIAALLPARPGHRAWPESGSEPLGVRRQHALPACSLDIGDMGDQRVEAWPPLGRIDAGDRAAIAGVRPQPVVRFPSGRRRGRLDARDRPHARRASSLASRSSVILSMARHCPRQRIPSSFELRRLAQACDTGTHLASRRTA